MRRLRGWAKRGSTMVEVLMAISVLAVGASGIISLQKVTIVANRNAKNLEVANEIARSWVERLHTDAMLWNHPSPLNPTSDITDTRWLASHVQDPGAAWFRPDDGNIHGVHDAFGKDDPSDNREGPFCVNLRLTWLRSDQDLIRAEVRVYWLRENLPAGAEPFSPLCDDDPELAAADMELYHVINVMTAVRKNQPF